MFLLEFEKQDILLIEGRSRYITFVAKFLDYNKSKRHLKSGIALFQTPSI